MSAHPLFDRNKRDVAKEAKAFLIWREGRSVNWNCTAVELAEATGISPRYVRQICAERGWKIQRSEPGERSEPHDIARVLGDLAGRRQPRSHGPNDPVKTLHRLVQEIESDAPEAILDSAD